MTSLPLLRSSKSLLVDVIPRLSDSLQNIPSITIRLGIPFGQKRTEKEIRKEITQLDEHGCGEVQANESEYQQSAATVSKGGVSMIPEDFFHDNGLLLAVPKKKVSYRRKRNRQLAPGAKQLKEIFSLDRCPSCGHYKRRHCLCMNCVSSIKSMWKERDMKEEFSPNDFIEQQLTDIEKQTYFPGKVESPDQKKLREKEYILQRPKTLPFDK